MVVGVDVNPIFKEGTDRIGLTVTHSQMEGIPTLVLGLVNFGTPPQEESGLVWLAVPRGEVKSGPTLPLPVFDVATELDKEFDGVEVGVADSILENGPAVLVFGCEIAALVNDEARK